MYSRFEKMEQMYWLMGTGLAGVTAVITAARKGCRVILLVKHYTIEEINGDKKRLFKKKYNHNRFNSISFNTVTHKS